MVQIGQPVLECILRGRTEIFISKMGGQTEGHLIISIVLFTILDHYAWAGDFTRWKSVNISLHHRSHRKSGERNSISTGPTNFIEKHTMAWGWRFKLNTTEVWLKMYASYIIIDVFLGFTKFFLRYAKVCGLLTQKIPINIP